MLSHDDRVLLFRTRQYLPRLFDDFNEECVLVHGNLSLRSMLKDPRSDQLLAMLNPGTVLWAPREYDLSRLSDEGMSEALLFHYLSRAPVVRISDTHHNKICHGLSVTPRRRTISPKRQRQQAALGGEIRPG